MPKFPRKNLLLSLIGVIVLGALTSYYAFNTPLNMTFYPTEKEIKTLSSSDISQLVTLHQECFEEVRRQKLLAYFRLHAQNPSGAGTSWMTERIEKLIQDHRLSASEKILSGSQLYVARQSSQIIGLFNCYDDNQYTDHGVMIYNVCLSKRLRGQGLGKQMMSYAIEHCQKPDKVLALTVYKDHKSTIALYEKLGFRLTQPLKAQDDGFDYFDKYFMLYSPQSSSSNDAK